MTSNKKIEKIFNDSIAKKVVPVRDKTIDLIINIIKEEKLKNILEIGTGLGYSASLINLNTKINQIITIEKNYERYKLACENLKNFKNIIVINDDCQKVNLKQEVFDFVFIDGPKSNQDKIILNLLENINKNSIILVDNIFLNNIRKIDNKTKNQKKLIEKLDQFIIWVKKQKLFSYNFLEIDDGVLILKLK